jgi:hypothetical protein
MLSDNTMLLAVFFWELHTVNALLVSVAGCNMRLLGEGLQKISQTVSIDTLQYRVHKLLIL